VIAMIAIGSLPWVLRGCANHRTGLALDRSAPLA
jgi:hypothetical protein